MKIVEVQTTSGTVLRTGPLTDEEAHRQAEALTRMIGTSAEHITAHGSYLRSFQFGGGLLNASEILSVRQIDID